MAGGEDLDAYFDPVNGMGVAAIYDGATNVNVTFDNAYVEGFGIAGVGPVAMGRASVFPAAAVGKTILINGTTYTIRGREPVDDGEIVRLTLKV